MSHSTLRILVCLGLAWPLLTSRAEAVVVGSALVALGHSPSVQPAQFVRPSCWYAEGWNGRGWYRCGDERNEGFGWIGPFNFPDFSGAALRRRHRHAVAHPHPPAHVYEPPRGLSAGPPPPFHSFGAGSGFRPLGVSPARPLAGPHAGSVHSPPALRPSAPAFPGFAAGRLQRLGAGGGRFHPAFGAGTAHIGAPPSPGFAGHAFHGLGAGGNIPGGIHAPSGFPVGRGPAAPNFRAGGGAPSFGGHAGGAR